MRQGAGAVAGLRKQAAEPLIALTLCWIVGLVASGWHPYDRATWWMEVAPVLWASARRFPLSGLALVLIGLHGLVLMLGGAYHLRARTGGVRRTGLAGAQP